MLRSINSIQTSETCILSSWVRVLFWHASRLCFRCIGMASLALGNEVRGTQKQETENRQLVFNLLSFSARFLQPRPPPDFEFPFSSFSASTVGREAVGLRGRCAVCSPLSPLPFPAVAWPTPRLQFRGSRTAPDYVHNTPNPTDWGRWPELKSAKWNKSCRRRRWAHDNASTWYFILGAS